MMRVIDVVDGEKRRRGRKGSWARVKLLDLLTLGRIVIPYLAGTYHCQDSQHRVDSYGRHGKLRFVVNDDYASSKSMYLLKSRFTDVNQEGTLFIFSLRFIASRVFLMSNLGIGSSTRSS